MKIIVGSKVYLSHLTNISKEYGTIKQLFPIRRKCDSEEFMTNLGEFNQIGFAIGGGFFTGILVGYALKKVVKVVAVVVGLFFAGLAYLQYQRIINIKWAKLQAVSQNIMITIANATTNIPGFGALPSHHESTLTISNLGIPLTGSISMGMMHISHRYFKNG
jgi:uncharacterized membrane protein (Fun14 family)